LLAIEDVSFGGRICYRHGCTARRAHSSARIIGVTGQGGSRLRTLLAEGHFVLTTEVTPPVTTRRQDVLAKAAPLRGLADAVNITDGAGAKVHLAAVAAAAMLAEAGIEPILQLVCRDRNRIALQSELLAAASLGIRNLLLLRGDNPEAGDQPEAKGVFDLDARALIATAARMRDAGELPTGTKLPEKVDFFIGAADTPIDPQPGWQPQSLKAKIDAGARFAQTQFCMDPALVRRYTARLAESGISSGFHLIVGVALLRSGGSAQWIRHHLPGAIIPENVVGRMQAATDARAEGVQVCLETIEALAAIPGVAGVHVMAPGNDAALPELLERARSLQLRRAPAPAIA
jgi:methylenetetrahydrofolate reductase (NADPH)